MKGWTQRFQKVIRWVCEHGKKLGSYAMENIFVVHCKYRKVNVVNGIIHRPIFSCSLLVRSTGEQDGPSRAELLSWLED